MSEDNIVKLITLAVVVAVIIGVILLIKSAVDSAKRKVRNMLNSSLLGQIKAATEETAKTPATLSGSEGLMKIRIAKDFPEFDAEIARKIVTGTLTQYFTILNARSGAEALSAHCTESFVTEPANSLDSVTTTYGGAKVHRAVISDYRKNGEQSTIIWQAAVEYTLPGKMLSQHVYEVRYSYYLAANSDQASESLICNNCGAPVTTLGAKVCEYCGAEVIASVERTWKINAITKTR